MPSRSLARITPICRNCGYDVGGLTGEPGPPLPDGRTTAICPECGTTFDPRRPWLWPPWPTRGRIVLRMVLPLMAAAPLAWIGNGGLARLTSVGVAPGWLGPVLVVPAFVVAVAGAIVVVTSMTDRHLPLPQGWWIKGGLVVLSLLVNVGGLIVLLVVV